MDRVLVSQPARPHDSCFENNDYFCQSIIGTILHSTNLHLRHVQLRRYSSVGQLVLTLARNVLNHGKIEYTPWRSLATV
jgi:hypothetical protein